MKKKDSRKFRIRRNSKGYWEKGGGCETELMVAVIALFLSVIAVGAAILAKIYGW